MSIMRGILLKSICGDMAWDDLGRDGRNSSISLGTGLVPNPCYGRRRRIDNNAI
jgi:hypothetical protein